MSPRRRGDDERAPRRRGDDERAPRPGETGPPFMPRGPRPAGPLRGEVCSVKQPGRRRLWFNRLAPVRTKRTLQPASPRMAPGRPAAQPPHRLSGQPSGQTRRARPWKTRPDTQNQAMEDEASAQRPRRHPRLGRTCPSRPRPFRVVGPGVAVPPPAPTRRTERAALPRRDTGGKPCPGMRNPL